MSVVFTSDELVPAVDSADNVRAADVIGNKTDSHSGDSIYGKLEAVEDHIHKESKVYPTLAAGVTLTAGASWVIGALVQVVPASTITDDFDIHAVEVEALSANDTYEIILYQGAGDTEIGRIRAVKNAVQSATINTPIQTPIVPANARIRAAVASATGGDTATISIRYHTY